MKILITGISGFCGYTICNRILQDFPNFKIFGIDNLSRPGSEKNVTSLNSLGVKFVRADIRNHSDIDSLPKVDWVIDCAANPSVLAGMDVQSSSRQLMEHNLLGTINLLEYCKKHKAGLILLSTSRVYSASELANLPVYSSNDRFKLEPSGRPGISENGISESFSTASPISLYGASKLASEALILEYGQCFDFPVWINRCGVLAGAGQFGKADQGIFSFWIHSFREKKPLKYIGFEGSGNQVRDALHPNDLVPLIVQQMQKPDRSVPKILNLGGGINNSISLKELSIWCEGRFGVNQVGSSQEERPMDAPWIVMDTSCAYDYWDWKPQTNLERIFNEIAEHAEKKPNWLELVS